MSKLLEYIAVEDAVKNIVGHDTFHRILHYLKSKNLIFWGGTDERLRIKSIFVFLVYKYANNIGYQRLTKMVKWPIVSSHKSWQHNTHVMLYALKEWGKSMIDVGQPGDWNTLKRGVALGGDVTSRINLAADSVDFPLQTPQGTLRTDEDWSYKCKSLGSRFMVIVDGKTRIRCAFGRYSPKLYDSHFIDKQKEWFNENLVGAVIVADQHFSTANNYICTDNLLFVTATQEAKSNKRKRGKGADKSQVAVQDPQVQSFNKKVYAWRSKSELPFAFAKNKFLALSQKFAEDKSYHECLVWFALGLYNSRSSLR